jgi:O-glycosyl hydrolase
VNGHIYWWGAANTTDNQSLLFVNNTSEVKVTKRLWAHAHFGSKFIRKGASRIDAGVTGSAALNVSAFANTDGSTAVQVINNGNETETVTLQGLNLSKRAGVVTYLTNQDNDLKRGYASIQRGNTAVAKVPANSLLSFVV